VEMVNRKLTGRNLHFYFNPGRDSHEDALKVHGISNEFLRDKPMFAEMAAEILDYLDGAELIIHNAPFDVGFLDKELELLGKPGIKNVVRGVIDTLVMAKEMWPGKRNSLDTLCDRLGVDNSGRTLHGALLDAELLADVYINMTRGQETLVIDMDTDTDKGSHEGTGSVNLSEYDLPVIMANEQELADHQEMLGQVDKASGSRTLWRQSSV
jgi:DNA polymerase III subunit epsilon